MIYHRLVLLLATVAAASLTFSARAAEPKKVILVTTTTGFRHGSIPFAQKTLAELAQSSGAFTIVDQCEQPKIDVPRKPNKPKDLAPGADEKAKAKYEKDMKGYEAQMAKWTPEVEAKAKAAQAELDAGIKTALEKLSPENLKAKGIDMVIFANTTGMLPLPDRDGFIKWIEEGHAFAAMHSGSDTFHQFPGYIDMLQGEFLTHRSQVPADLVAGDTSHPANAGIGSTWDIKQEEMYIIKSQDPQKVHSLWFLRHDPNFPDPTPVVTTATAEAGSNIVMIDSAADIKPGWLVTGNAAFPSGTKVTGVDAKNNKKITLSNPVTTALSAATIHFGERGLYPVSWCRKAGQGRVFYTSLGHREDLWSADPAMSGRINSVETAKQYQAHILGGIKWALGLVEGSSDPNPEVK